MAGLNVSGIVSRLATNPTQTGSFRNPYNTVGTPPATISDAAGRAWEFNPSGYDQYGSWGQVTPVWQTYLDKFMGMLGGAAGPYGSAGGGGAMLPPPTLPGQVGAPQVRAVAPSQSEAFGRAKDASSRIYGKAMEALKDQMTAAGISGSGVEGRLMGNMLSDAARYQSDAELKQQLEAQRQSWEAAKEGYQGSMGQRATDIGAGTNIYDIAQNAATSQWNAQFNRANPMLDALTSIIGGMVPRPKY